MYHLYNLSFLSTAVTVNSIVELQWQQDGLSNMNDDEFEVLKVELSHPLLK